MFLIGYSGEQIQWRQGGACSSEDQSTWLRTTVSGVRIPPRPQPTPKGRTFPLWEQENHDRDSGPKAMELVSSLQKWNGLTVLCFIKSIEYALIFESPFCFTLPQPGLGRIAEQVKYYQHSKNAFLVINMFASGNCGFSGELMNASKMHLLLLVPVHLIILNCLV